MKKLSYEKLIKRYEKIFKHSDKQELKILQLKEKVEELYNYNISQEKTAKKKIEKLIKVDYKNTKIVYRPSDILSGDFYSILKTKEGYIAYIIDGQGHGVAPALTIFGIASTIKAILSDFTTFEDFIKELFSHVKIFLDEMEQVSFSFVYFNKDFSFIKYSIGGMYPIFLKTQNDIIKIKANSTPFLAFKDIPKIDYKEVNFSKMLLYSDALREEFIGDNTFHPKNLIENESLIDKLNSLDRKLGDDLTILLIKR